MVSQDILLTGIPRSGTTLTCSLLNRLPDVLALIEPMDMRRLIAAGSDADRMRCIADYLAEVRDDAAERGIAPRKILEGDGTNTFSASAHEKRGSAIIGNETGPLERSLPPDFTLVVKHPNAFAALLPSLAQRFKCFALVRNPLSVIASWSSLDHPLRDGHAPMAEQFDPALAARLRQETGPLERQLALLDWYFDRFRRVLPTDHVLRYEDVIATSGAALAVIAASATTLPERPGLDLRSQNVSQLYTDRSVITRAADRLLQDGSQHCWSLYDHNSVIGLRESLLAQ